MKKNGRVREGGEGQRRFSWMDFFANYCIIIIIQQGYYYIIIILQKKKKISR
jgi:hypothetical protein